MERQHLRRQFNKLNELLVKIRTQLSEIIRTIGNANYVLERFMADERRRALERHRLEWEKNNNGPSLYNSLAEDEID